MALDTFPYIANVYPIPVSSLADSPVGIVRRPHNWVTTRVHPAALRSLGRALEVAPAAGGSFPENDEDVEGSLGAS